MTRSDALAEQPESKRAVAALIAGTILGRASMLLVIIVVTRLLDQTAVALVIVGQAIAAYVVIVVEFGLTTAGIRAVSRVPQDVTKTIGAVLVSRLALAAGAIGIVAVASSLVASALATEVIVLSAIAVAIGVIDTSWAIQALGRPLLRGAIAALTGVSALLAVTVLLLVQAEPQMVPLGMLIATGISSGLALIATVRLVGPPKLPSGLELRHVALVAVPLGVSNLLAQIYYNFDLVFMAIVRPAGEVATYGALYKIILGIQMVSITYGSAWLSRYSRAFAARPRQFTADLSANVARLGIVIIPVTVVLLLFGSEILDALFGVAYANGGAALGILGISVALAFTTGTCLAALSAAGDGWFVSRVIAGAALGNIGLNVVLIPTLGMLGAAIATLVSEGLVLLGLTAGRPTVLKAFARARFFRLLPSAVLAAGTAGLLGVIAPWGVAAAAAFASYAVSVVVGGLWPKNASSVELA